MYTLGPDQLNDKARLVSFGEKVLASNPKSLAALLLLANFYGDDAKPGSAAKAITYSQKVIEIAKVDAPDADILMRSLVPVALPFWWPRLVRR